jgi:sulfur carrier protein
MPEIRIQLNGEQQSIAAPASLQQLLEVFSLPQKRVAIELNGNVVSRNKWPETIVADGDRLEVVYFVGGG